MTDNFETPWKILKFFFITWNIKIKTLINWCAKNIPLPAPWLMHLTILIYAMVHGS